MYLRTAVVSLVLLVVSCGGNSDNGSTPPRTTIPTLSLTQVATGLTNPVGLESARDGSGRLFVPEQAGTIRILQNGTVNAAPFLSIGTLVESGGERGLLGLAFHPNFTANRKFYVNYTRRNAGQLQTVIAEYLVSAANPNQADTATERILLTLDQPFQNHNGGQLAFGPDGFLYIGLGDGGGSGDPQGNAQNPQRLLGKILRIDISATSPGKQYGIPASNPFANGASGAPEVYAYGLRNPWRFSFDAATSRLFVADVGEGAFEEIDIVESGKNYGWPIMEGMHCFDAQTCNQAGLTAPIVEYGHGEGESVTGGFVYRGSAISGLVGVYVVADFINGRIWTVAQDGATWTRTLAISSGRNISSFGQDQNGDLYVVDYGGTILKLVAQ